MSNPAWLLVGVVYAAAVWLARSGGVELPRRIAFFFYALVVVFLWAPLTQDVVGLPVDFLKSLPPWNFTTRNWTLQNAQLNDLALQIVPWAHQVRESWRALHAPLWNHFSGGGYPLLGNMQSSALSPLRLLALPLSLAHAMAAEAAMKLLVALTFTFLYCRKRGYAELASVIGAIAFGFCTFLVVWLHFPMATSACFLPAVLYCVDLLLERRTYARFVAAAVVWAVMLFGGHPETASHTFFLASLYVAWVLLVERPLAWRDALRLVITLGGALAVAGLLAAPLLAPFAEALTKSKRYHELKANPPTAEVPYSDEPSARVLLQPHFTGQIPMEKSWGPADAESITGFAGFFGIAAWFALLAELIGTRTWRRRETFFLLMTVFVLGVILAWPGFSETFHLAFKLAANARLRLLFALLLSLQTAAAVDLLQR
ncbi:MAG TPA: YfhO family protein, partial [Thermoanaerobaculia bacterium]|nr:YfhO family protein [Thermoanaerobaculia bacterium]